MAEEEEEAVVFFKNAYLLQLMHIGGITTDGGCFPLTIKRERLEIDVGSIAQEETTLEQVFFRLSIEPRMDTNGHEIFWGKPLITRNKQIIQMPRRRRPCFCRVC